MRLISYYLILEITHYYEEAMQRFGKIIFLLLFVIGITNVWAGNPDEFEEFRRGVVVLSIYKNIDIDIPVEGARRADVVDIDLFMDQVGATKIERKYPFCLPPKSTVGDLTGIYTMYIPESLTPADVAGDLQLLASVEYAEVWPVHRVCLDHNDGRRNQQYYLDNVEANAAHDLATGNSETIVGIIDTGTDLDHSDLVDNLWLNPGEDLNGNGEIDDNERNGQDDDRNGLVDDFYGWDYYSRDDDPDDESGHGTHCSGDASAVTNNNRGIASVGYSCTIMPVRTGHQLQITHGYNGIEYAVRSGAHVVSLSWGGGQGGNGPNQVIQYAHDNDVMVIAAAGNDNQDGNFYPARYENVIAVAATNSRDEKAGFSNYGDWVDISAPGVAIHSTTRGGGYGDSQGTSMACPIVAGAAVLIRSAYPWLSGDEVAEILIEGADDVIQRAGMGSGRLNVYESLVLGARPMLSIEDFEIMDDDNDDGHIDPGETIDIAITVSNSEEGVLAENINLMILPMDSDVEIENNVIEFPDLEPGDSFTNEDNPFQIVISEDAIPHTTWLQLNVNAEPADANISKTYEIVIGHPSILVVDDDESEDAHAANTIYRAIEKNDMGWAHWVARENYTPDLATLLEYEMVIWVTGDTENPLDDLDRFQIESSLEEDGNMLLIGNRIGDDEENHQLLNRYFGADHDEDEISVRFANGISDNRPLDTAVEMMLFNNTFEGPYDATESASTMSVVNDGDSLLVYTRMNDDVVGLAAIYNVLDFGERSESRTVYMGFAFEAVRDDILDLTNKDIVIDGLYQWFTGELNDAPDLSGILPETYSLSPAFPNPFNGSLLINFNLPTLSAYQISIIDIAGRNVADLSSGISTVGANSIVWEANTQISSGNYFVKLSSPGRKTLLQKVILLK